MATPRLRTHEKKRWAENTTDAILSYIASCSNRSSLTARWFSAETTTIQCILCEVSFIRGLVSYSDDLYPISSIPQCNPESMWWLTFGFAGIHTLQTAESLSKITLQPVKQLDIGYSNRGRITGLPEYRKSPQNRPSPDVEKQVMVRVNTVLGLVVRYLPSVIHCHSFAVSPGRTVVK